MKITYTDEQSLAMRKFYSQFVQPGDLVFNIGANVGTRTQTFAELGAQIIAVEPQPGLAEVLRIRFRDHMVRIPGQHKYSQQVLVIEAAAGPKPGVVDLMLCTDNQLATCEPGWAESLRDRWPAEKWERKITVQQITLDQLIKLYGEPSFIKIDIEGYEYQALRGLCSHVPCLCFEATIPFVDPAIECISDLFWRLGMREFNYLVQEKMELVFDDWISAARMKEILHALPQSTFYVDVFAR